MLFETSINASAVETADMEVKAAVLASASLNPALQRLQARIRAGSAAGDLITSYDRMHHRHSRS